MKYRPYQRIEIFWTDSVHQEGWTEPENLKWNRKSMEQRTIGYFIKETKYSIAVCQSYGENREQIDAIMEIPKAAVLRVRRL